MLKFPEVLQMHQWIFDYTEFTNGYYKEYAIKYLRSLDFSSIRSFSWPAFESSTMARCSRTGRRASLTMSRPSPFPHTPICQSFVNHPATRVQQLVHPSTFCGLDLRKSAQLTFGILKLAGNWTWSHYWKRNWWGLRLFDWFCDSHKASDWGLKVSTPIFPVEFRHGSLIVVRFILPANEQNRFISLFDWYDKRHNRIKQVIYLFLKTSKRSLFLRPRELHLLQNSC